MSEKQNIFETLSKISVANHVEKKMGLSYLSWAWCWSTLKSIYPDTPVPKPTMYQEMIITKDGYQLTDRQVPYLTTPKGTMVEVTVTIQGVDYVQSLYVMDNRNRTVINPDMSQINKTIQRCTVKAIAMAGLGLNLYAGEDLPMGDINESDQKQAAEKKVKQQEKANFEKAKKKYVAYMEQLQDLTKQSADVINDQAKQRVLKADPDYNKRTPLEKMLIINTFLEKMLSESKATKQETLEEVDA